MRAAAAGTCTHACELLHLHSPQVLLAGCGVRGAPSDAVSVTVRLRHETAGVCFAGATSECTNHSHE
jgi:hypothetical protein